MRRLRPGVRMIAAEAETANPAAAALVAGGPVRVKHTSSFVDGIGSSTVLDEMWPLLLETVDAAVSVSLAEIAEAIRLLASRHHVIAEGAGAPGLGGGGGAVEERAGAGDIRLHRLRRQHRRVQARPDPSRAATVIAPSELSRIVFGCGNFGGLGSSPALRGRGDGRELALTLLDHARELGLTRYDTANTYGGGVSETVLGEWLGRQDAGFRARVEVATKVGNPVGCPPGEERPLSRSQIAHHLDESLRRLGQERIDLYYLHEFDPATPLEETLEALGQALEAGKIARFGVSNATADDLRAVLRLTAPMLAAFTNVQNGFNRLETSDLAEVIPLAAQRGLRYVAFSPLAGGLLSGKYQLGRPPQPGTRLDAAPGFFDRLLNPATFEAISDLQAHADSRGWTLPEAALRFILDTPGVDSLIIAPRSLEQFAAYAIGA